MATGELQCEHPDRRAQSARPAPRMSRLPGCPTFQALATFPGPVISLAWGVPAPDLLPGEQMTACLQSPLPAAALQYGDLFGDLRLRAVLQGLLAARGIRVPLEQIAVLTGGSLGIELFTRLLVAEDEAILLETPAFSEAIRIFRAYSDHLVAVPADAEGLIPQALEAALAGLARRGIRPRLLYTVPTYHNPSGATTPPARRRLILDLALRHGVTILEDDPYYQLPFAEPPPPPLRALGEAASVIYLDSFSKSLAPGLRVGWAVVPPELIEPLQRLKQCCDFSPIPFAQEAAFRFCEAGHLEPHLATLRAAYRQRKEALFQAVRQYLPSAAVRVDPGGGFFLWLDLPGAGPNTDALLPAALAAGVSFIPGATLDITDASRRSLRLAYSFEPPQRLVEGVRRLAGILEPR